MGLTEVDLLVPHQALADRRVCTVRADEEVVLDLLYSTIPFSRIAAVVPGNGNYGSVTDVISRLGHGCRFADIVDDLLLRDARLVLPGHVLERYRLTLKVTRNHLVVEEELGA